MIKVSAAIITFNEDIIIEKTLSKLDWCNEIVIVDSGSTDKTIEICEKYGCNIYYNKFEGFGQQKQFALNKCKNNWVLSIDADEILSDNLKTELINTFNTDKIKYNGFYLPFATHYLGKTLKFCGLKHEKHLRLINKKHAHFTTPKVHESIIVDGEISKMKNKIIHHTYRNLSHHLYKMNNYTDNAATEYLNNNKKISRFKAIIKFPVSFFIVYIIKGGIFDGYQGFMWSLFSAFYTSLKYAKLIEKQLQ
jgi:glycosyltransferase involved in cell wall biosynthesis